jgi:dolichol kinase
LQAGPPAVRLSARAPVSAPSNAPAFSGGGEPLSPSIQSSIESSLGVSLQSVRVHTNTQAQNTAALFSARAVTHGNHIFLGAGERPTDLKLMAHESAHVVQQQAAPAVQLWAPGQSDPCEHEAHQAAAAVAGSKSFNISRRTTPRIQRLGISDALDFFANQANNIPGFRMFTIIIGVNPINMSPVARSAANIMRAIVEFIPGGGLITQALDNYGIFDRVGNWVDQQIRTLGMTGSIFREAINRFVSSLGLMDLLHLGGVWDRAKRIFTQPIRRLISFASGLATGIIGFIKDAILRPLARLAQGTRGWDLLIAVLGQNPITGEPVPRTAETLIGGFMKLIGQEEVWNNLKRANAVARAWAWFQGALSGLLGFVRQIPSLFMQALRSLELMDIVLLPRAFGKVATVFGSFLGQFFSWAGRQVMSLLEIIFEVLAPGAMPYIRRAAGALRSIFQNPIGFLGNLVRAGIQGFRQFAGNFLTHLRASLIGWLTGAMSGANIYIPQAVNLREIVKFVLSVLGLTWQNIRQKLVRATSEGVVRALETGFDIVVTLVREGPAAAWEKIKESISNLREMVMEQVMTFVRDRVVQAAITRLLTSLNPVGAFIQAVIAIYNTIMFFVERLRQIAQVAMSFIDSISAIAGGVIATAANRVEQTMAGLLTLVISFLARIAGLGRVSDAVIDIINRVRAPIDRALDRVVEWIVNMARRLGRLFVRAGERGPSDPAQAAALASLDGINRRFADGAGRDELQEAITQVKQQHPVFKILELRERAGDFEFYYGFSPGSTKPGPGAKLVRIKLRRPSGFRAATKDSLKATFPGEHKQSYTTRAVVRVSEARRHIIPSQEMLTHIETSLNGKTLAEAKTMLEGKASPGVTVPRLTNNAVQEAAQMLLRNFFNDVENLWVGNAAENSSLQDTWDFPRGWTDEKIWTLLIGIKQRYMFH